MGEPGVAWVVAPGVMVSYRQATSEDIEGIETVDRALDQRTAAPDVIQRAIADNRVTVAHDAGTIAGYVRWGWFWDKIPYVEIARIHPDHQREGHGRALYAAIETRLRALGHTFYISSTEEDNERSRRFHAALGFREIGSLSELGQNVREVFLRKDLVDSE